jgi:ketosteroid isomerase-like protein
LTLAGFRLSVVAMSHHVRAIAAPLFILALSCTPEKNLPKPFAPDRTAEATLLVADRSFARDTEDRGVEGWSAAFADDGAQIVSNQPLVQGRMAVRELMKPFFADGTSRLRWEPERASVSASGDLGYTFGHAQMVKVVAGAETVVAKLQYLTVWKRQLDGTWKVAMDVGTPEL